MPCGRGCQGDWARVRSQHRVGSAPYPLRLQHAAGPSSVSVRLQATQFFGPGSPGAGPPPGSLVPGFTARVLSRRIRLPGTSEQLLFADCFHTLLPPTLWGGTAPTLS